MPSESDVRMQVFMHLTCGYTGIAYFTYEDQQGPAMIEGGTGRRRPIYYDVARLNIEVGNLGAALRFLESTAVRYVPQGGNDVPDGVTAWKPGDGGDTIIEAITIEGGEPAPGERPAHRVLQGRRWPGLLHADQPVARHGRAVGRAGGDGDVDAGPEGESDRPAVTRDGAAGSVGRRRGPSFASPCPAARVSCCASGTPGSPGWIRLGVRPADSHVVCSSTFTGLLPRERPMPMSRRGAYVGLS